MLHFILVLSSCLFLAAPIHAQVWVRGALALHSVSGEVELSALGEKTTVLGAGQVPLSLSGLVNAQAAYGSSALFSTSNRTFFLFEGGGSFAVERFEQILPDADTWATSPREPSQSRMILNFRMGHLVVDSRKMLDASQCLIETPLGRVSVKRALWQMTISFDQRSQIFDFTITCHDGRVRFTDLNGQQYTLRTGQRLAGAGARNSPSVEVGESTDRAKERMQKFQDRVRPYVTAADDLALYTSYFQEIEQAVREPVSLMEQNARSSGRHPIVIEYASEPDPVTPFRAEVRPPSAYQADLF